MIFFDIFAILILYHFFQFFTLNFMWMIWKTKNFFFQKWRRWVLHSNSYISDTRFMWFGKIFFFKNFDFFFVTVILYQFFNFSHQISREWYEKQKNFFFQKWRRWVLHSNSCISDTKFMWFGKIFFFRIYHTKFCMKS